MSFCFILAVNFWHRYYFFYLCQFPSILDIVVIFFLIFVNFLSFSPISDILSFFLYFWSLSLMCAEYDFLRVACTKSFAIDVRNLGLGVYFIIFFPTPCSGLNRAVKYGNNKTENLESVPKIFPQSVVSNSNRISDSKVEFDGIIG